MTQKVVLKCREGEQVVEHVFQGEKVGYAVPSSQLEIIPTFRVWADEQTLVILLSDLICCYIVEDDERKSVQPQRLSGEEPDRETEG